MSRNLFTQLGWKSGLLGLAFLLTSGAESTWLKGRSKKTEGLVQSSFVSNCPPRQVRCLCGSDDDEQYTLINIKRCAVTSTWGSLCEPCQGARSPDEFCRDLQFCARCMPDNPQAICAECPIDRHGLHCKQERPCKAPNVTEHVLVSRKGKNKLSFGCTGGRVLRGSKVIRCQKKTAAWNHPPPTCALPMLCSTPPPTPIAFTHIKERTQERVIYECDEGYVTSGSILETALLCDNGVWVKAGEEVKCEARPMCPSPPIYRESRLQEGTPVKSTYQSGESVLYACQDGFSPLAKPNETFSLTCVGKTWEGPGPACELKGCPWFAVDAGRVEQEDSTNSSQSSYVPLGERVKVTCQPGFLLHGPSLATCSSTGQWHPSVPVCVAEGCEDVHQGKMCTLNATGNVIFLTNKTEIYPGQSVLLGCREGTFRKRNIGVRERICLYNGSLSAVAPIQCDKLPVCKIDTRGDPKLKFCIQSGGLCKPGEDRYHDNVYEFPEDVVPHPTGVFFECDAPYRLNGSNEAQCTHNYITALTTLTTPIPYCLPECGKRHSQKTAYIRGGSASEIADWPWQAGLVEGNRYFQFLCGATIIDERWAVTAAHCLQHSKSKQTIDVSRLKLTYGLSGWKQALSADTTKEKKFEVAEVFVHGGFDPESLDNDIALVKLRAAIAFNSNVSPVCLPAAPTCSRHQPLVKGREGKVTGWGPSGLQSDILRELSLFVADNSECNKLMARPGYHDAWTDNMICAKSNSTKQDTTGGDSGGPFVMLDGSTNSWVLEGIVSWGLEKRKNSTANAAGDATPNRSGHTGSYIQGRRGVDLTIADGQEADPLSSHKDCWGETCYSSYARVAKYLKWIEEKTGIAYNKCLD